MKKLYVFFAFLLFLTGCAVLPTEQVHTDPTRILYAEQDWYDDHTINQCGVFLSSDGYVYPISPYFQMRYDWDAFNADHGPFFDLKTDGNKHENTSYSIYVQKQDLSWIAIPPYDRLERYIGIKTDDLLRGYFDFAAVADSYDFADELLDHCERIGNQVFLWISDVGISRNSTGAAMVRGTLEAVVRYPEYNSVYAKEHTMQILYSSVDLSDCHDSNAQLRKLIQTCPGTLFEALIGFDTDASSIWIEQLPAVDFDDPKPFLPETEQSAKLIKSMPCGVENPLILSADGTVSQRDPLFPESSEWDNICDIFMLSQLLIGVRTDGTLCTAYYRDMTDQARLRLEETEWFRFLGEMRNVKQVAFQLDGIPVFLLRDGTLDYPMSSDFKEFEAVALPQYGYTDAIGIQIDLDRVYCLLRCADGRTVVLQGKYDWISLKKSLQKDFGFTEIVYD